MKLRKVQKMAFKVPEKYRVKTGAFASDESYGNCGAFQVHLQNSQQALVIASDAFGWEHVSVSRTDRCPTWDEMCQVKRMFWDESDCVLQYHPPKNHYVNNHPYCLHLWRPVGLKIPMPPSIMVGVKG